jgi:aspartate/methionine/tyrosine aminotransferase
LAYWLYAVSKTSINVSEKIQDTILICPPVISQYAANGALKAGKSYCSKTVVIYALPLAHYKKKQFLKELIV